MSENIDLQMFDFEYIKRFHNEVRMAGIKNDNEQIATLYRSRVEAWDAQVLNSGGDLKTRPKPPVKDIPYIDVNGDVCRMRDPAGTLVCAEVPIPEGLFRKSKPEANHVSMGAIYDSTRRLCNWDDTVADGATIVNDGDYWQKVAMQTPFGLVR